MKFNIFVFGLIYILNGAVAADSNEPDAKNVNPYHKHRTDRQRHANYILNPVYWVCATNNNAPISDITILDHRDLYDTDEPLKCTIDCIFRRLGVISPDYQLDPKYTKYFFFNIYREDEKKVDSAIEKCQNTTGTSKCDIGFQIYACLVLHDL